MNWTSRNGFVYIFKQFTFKSVGVTLKYLYIANQLMHASFNSRHFTCLSYHAVHFKHVNINIMALIVYMDIIGIA